MIPGKSVITFEPRRPKRRHRERWRWSGCGAARRTV